MSISTEVKESSATLNDNGFQFQQHGFLLNGRCTVVAERQNILVATLGEQVVGMCELPLIREKFEESGQYTVHFSMQLNAEKITANLSSTVSISLLSEAKYNLVTIECIQLFLEAMNSYHPIDILAPSYGYFGGGKLEPLIVDVNQDVTSLKVSLDDENFLNLRQIKLFDDENSLIDLDDDKVQLTFSSSVDENQKASSFKHDRGFHSKLEQGPWFTLSFEVPQHISRLEVYNRADKWGVRSQRLNVNVQSADGRNQLVYDAFSDQGKAQFFKKLIQLLGWSSPGNCESYRLAMLKKVLGVLNDSSDTLSAQDFVYFLQFLPIWAEPSASDQERQLELDIFSRYVFHSTKEGISFTFIPFSDFLRTTSDLDSVEAEVNRLRALDKLGPLQITKHGLAHQGMLVRNTDMVLRSMETVMTDLEQLGLRPCLAYGTLLGAVREGAFIAHDDDVDLFVECNDAGPDEQSVFQWTENLLQQLDSEKYRTDLEVRNGKNLNIHIAVKETGMVLDIFPYWHRGKKCAMHMEKMVIREVDGAIFDGRSKVMLYGKEFAAPGKPEAFLLERYGKDWTISDKYHEWPWQLVKGDELK